jgi:hypothetical protein
MEIKNVCVEEIGKLFEKILYKSFSGNRIGVNSYDEVIQAKEIL